MSRFDFSFSAGNSGDFFGADSNLSRDDLLDVLRPAAIHLREAYKHTLRQRFKRRSGQLVDSIDIEDDSVKYNDTNYAFFRVSPYGRRKKSMRKARSRSGPADRKYAKHNREAKATRISNAELAYLLEYGTPRIAATHWMGNTNEAVEVEIQQMIEDEFQKLLEKKGL